MGFIGRDKIPERCVYHIEETWLSGVLGSHASEAVERTQADDAADRGSFQLVDSQDRSVEVGAWQRHNEGVEVTIPSPSWHNRRVCSGSVHWSANGKTERQCRQGKSNPVMCQWLEAKPSWVTGNWASPETCGWSETVQGFSTTTTRSSRAPALGVPSIPRRVMRRRHSLIRVPEKIPPYVLGFTFERQLTLLSSHTCRTQLSISNDPPFNLPSARNTCSSISAYCHSGHLFGVC